MRRVAAIGLALVLIGGAVLTIQLPTLAAGGLLYPARHRVNLPAPPGCDDASFDGVGVTLAGWRCAAREYRRATIVYLHGVADNRTSVRGLLRRFTRQGFDVIAYDSRAHGESGGELCTYGYYEKQDLRRVLDTISSGPIVLIGASLGAAVALQAAGEDARVSAVVAAETFSDLRTVARERAPVLLTSRVIRQAFTIAEARGRFSVDAVSPVAAAARVRAPVLLVHGTADVETSPDHSRRVLAALGRQARLILVDGAGHNQALSGTAVWQQIDQWLRDVLALADAAPHARTFAERD
jgi:uncharacterized protein